MKSNASSNPKIITGALYRSIMVGRAKKRRTGRSITIGVHHSAEGAFYANPLEFGHGGPAPAPAHPFVRPAYDAKADESYDIIRAGLRDAVSRS
jgi:HK97 gp10 family phage protein